MSEWIIYATIALSISLTSYINIYKPALDLYKEITEESNPIFGSIIYKMIWIVVAFIMAPATAFMLIRGGNERYIKNLVLAWIGPEDEE